MCTNYAINMVTYNNKSVTDNTVNSDLCFYTEPCPDTWQCITDKYRFSAPVIWWYINTLFYFASMISRWSYAAVLFSALSKCLRHKKICWSPLVQCFNLCWIPKSGITYFLVSVTWHWPTNSVHVTAFFLTKCYHLLTVFATIYKNCALRLICFKSCTSQVSGIWFKSTNSQTHSKNAIHLTVTFGYVLVTCDSNITIIQWLIFLSRLFKSKLCYIKMWHIYYWINNKHI